MDLIQNAPLAAILLYLSGGVICSVLNAGWAKRYMLVLNAVVSAMMVGLLVFCLRTGESYVYTMGHYPAPWGNEIRVGVLEALLAALFPFVMELSLLGGMEHIFDDCEAKKINNYFSVISLLMSSLMALIFTNDIFTAYVFVEINTMSSCALVMFRYKNGKTLIATAQYLIMSLLGSGMILIAISLLYDLTGHLLMENIHTAVLQLTATGQYVFPLTVIVAFFAIGLSVKSALFPFHGWLPDAHGSATASSSAVLSGLVLKGYIVLLLKIFYRMFSLEMVALDKAMDLLLVFGAGAMLFGSLSALREQDLKRMLAYSSVAQVGYIFLAIGLKSQAAMVAAVMQIVVHAVTKPMLFCATGGFMDVSGGSKRMENIWGAGRRDPLGGAAFALGSLSMIGIPLTAGFATKFYLTQAAVSALGPKGILALAAVVISTILNAMYYIPALGQLFGHRTDGNFAGVKMHYRWDYVLAMTVFMAINVLVGVFSGTIARMIAQGLAMFG